MASEQISLRDLRTLLERMLDFDFIQSDPSKYIVFDERLATRHKPDAAWLSDAENIAAFVRTGCKRYISHKYARGAKTLPAWLLDARIEETLSWRGACGPELSREDEEALLAAVKNKLEQSIPPAGSAVVITTLEARAAFRRLVERTFPNLAVLSYQELLPDVNIQLIGRIEFDLTA